MILADLINTKIKDIAKKQLRYWHTGITNTEIDSLIVNITFTNNWSNINEVRNFVNSHDALSNMEDLSFYIQCAHGVVYPEYSNISANQIRKRMESEPQNILVAYFWIHKHLLGMIDEEVYVELPFFLDEILDRYPDLINLDDFLENSISIILNEEVLKRSPRLYIPVFEKATKKYPNKKSFCYFLTISHLYDGNLKFAFDIFNYLHKWMLDKFVDYQNENVEDNFYFYHYTTLVKELLNSLEESSECNWLVNTAEMVQEVYFSKFQNADQERYTYTDFFVELFFRKMRALIHLEKFSAIKFEHRRIEPYLQETETDFWKSDYVDVFEVLHNIKLQ